MPIPSPRDGAAALITGASSGIGAELARQLCEQGHDAILVARRRDRLDSLAVELRSRYGRRVEVIACDVSDPDARGRLVTDVALSDLDIDVLALCAGFGMTGPFLSQPAERITSMVRTNLEAVMALSRELIPPMAARHRGAVLIVSSMAGNQPMPNFAAYSATKAAMTSFAESLHDELKRSGVTVTALCPGGVRTEFAEVAGATSAERRTPSALLIGPEECARSALEGLEADRRIVMPLRAVRLFAWFGSHAPRSIWFPICRRLMA
jgi:short-subunit dehydrogenase